MAITGKRGGVSSVNTANAIVFVNESTEASADLKTYRITDAAKRCISNLDNVVVKINGTEFHSGFVIVYTLGKIVFTIPRDIADIVTVSGKYFTPVLQVGFTEWTVDVDMETVDTSTFESDGFKEYMATVLSAKGSAKSFFNITTTSNLPLGETVLLKLYIDKAAGSYASGYALIKSKKLTVGLKPVEESLEFEFYGPVSIDPGSGAEPIIPPYVPPVGKVATGKVTLEDGTTAVSGATVEVRETSTYNLLGTAVTNASGNFSIPVTTTYPDCSIVARKTGYYTGRSFIPNFSTATLVRMGLAGTVDATVYATNGTTKLQYVNYVLSNVLGGSSGSSTNQDGFFTADLAPGTYDLTVNEPGYAEYSNNGIVVTVGNTVHLGKIILQPQ